MKTVGKVILATILAYAGLMLASFVGGVLGGFLGATFRSNSNTINALTWTFPKVIFLGILMFFYLRSRRKKEKPQD